MGVFPEHVSMYHMFVWYLQIPKESIKSAGTRITDSCEPSCMCREWNLGPLEEQLMRLTAESSFQTVSFNYLFRS